MCFATQFFVFRCVDTNVIFFSFDFSVIAADKGMESSGISKGRFGLENQEHLVKLAILTTAAILCEYFVVIHVENEFYFWGYKSCV